MTLESKIIDIEIARVAFGGDGVGHDESGKVVFVPGTLPGERIKALLVQEKDRYSRAELVRIITPSPQRITPACPYAIQPGTDNPGAPRFCPGCCYQHLAYSDELELKNSQFRDFLERQAGIDPAEVCKSPVPSPEELNYRNKIVLHAQGERDFMQLGYFLSDNSSVLDVEECPLAKKPINELLRKQRSQTGFFHTLRDRMTVTFRHTEHDGAILWRNQAKTNDKWLREETSLGTLAVPRGSFFQVNGSAAELLISEASSIIKRIAPDTVLDLFCGVGIFSFVAAKCGVKRVVGVDSDAGGITAAEYNAKQLKMKNCRFVRGDAAKNPDKFFRNVKGKSSLLLVDPPRKGLSQELIPCIEKNKMRYIIYISCAPDTLCRDLKELIKRGYRVKQTGLIDMFPRTSHFESVTLLEKNC